MRIASFDDHRVGIVDGDELVDVTALLPVGLDAVPHQRINWLAAHWDDGKAAISMKLETAERRPLASVRLLAANPRPGQIFAAPANYRKHIGELKDRVVTKGGRSAREQGFFLKAPSSVLGAGGTIDLPKDTERRFDHESELAVVICREARNVHRDEALAYVFGYSCLIDATMRIEPGVAEEERTMRKSFEGFTPLGPFIVTADEIPDPQALRNRLSINGEVRQDASTSEMIVGVAEFIELVTSVTTLYPGDVLATGTPEGVGPFLPGDTITIEIERVGRMDVHVRQAAQHAPRRF